MKAEHCIARLCQAFEVSPSGYYDWSERQEHPSQRQQLDQQLQRGRLDQRLIALQVDDGVGADLPGNLSNAISAAGMIAPGHDHLAAKAPHPGHDARGCERAARLGVTPSK